jgi:hypothetical protein
MKNNKNGFVIPLIIAIVAILTLGGVFLVTKNKEVEAPLVVKTNFISGTADQKRIILNDFMSKVVNYNSISIPKDNQTKIDEIVPYIPDVIDAITDVTLLPIENDKGWDVYHYANTIMCVFAKRVDNIQRCKDPEYSFDDNSDLVNDVKRRVVRDNWLKWWSDYENSVKNITNTISTTTPIVGGDKDVHGCIGSAGYSWCEVKNKCLRVWEEKCENTPINSGPGDKDGSVACTMDAMMCPDGTYVGRSAPDCKFICPAVEPNIGAGENGFCGGIAGIRCASGLTCKYDGTYPDAGGKCIK